jgi:hypothetical protein
LIVASYINQSALGQDSPRMVSHRKTRPPFATPLEEPRNGAETTVRMPATVRESPNDSAASAM